MPTKVQKWGKSQGVRIPSTLLKEAHISVGEEVEITVQGSRLVVSPVATSQRIRGRYRLEDLLAQIPDDYEAAEENWGSAVGCEIW